MTFANPSFLWALGALSIPILIHLFNFRKTKRVYFSNNRFLRNVKEASTSKRRLKHYLILASRLLFLLFLILAFCQPFLPAREELNSSRRIVFYLDNSESMSIPSAQKVRNLETGVEFIRSVINTFPANVRYRLITNDFAPFSNTFKSKPEIEELLTRLRPSPLTRSFEEVKQRIVSTDFSASDQLFYISDFQKSTLGDIDEMPDTTMQWRLVSVPNATASNVFVDTVFLSNPFATKGERNALRARLRNDGNKETNQLNVKLSINNIQRGTSSLVIPATGSAEINFDLQSGLEDLNKGKIEFNDFPVTFDNEFYFTLNYTDKIRILEIKSASTPTPVERVYANQEIFSFKSAKVDNVDYSLLDDADLVVLNGLNAIPVPLVNALQQFVQTYKSLLVIPGSEPEIPGLQQLVVTNLSVSPGSSFQELDKPDFNNPFYENVFEDKEATISMPRAIRKLNWGTDRSALLKFKNGDPYLSHFNRAGNVYLLASSLDDSQTDFFRHAIFVPVMYRIAASSKQKATDIYYKLSDHFISLTLDTVRSNDLIRLHGQSEIVPTQRRVGNSVFLDLPKYELSQGFYHVTLNEDTVNLVAFNPDKMESILARYRVEEVKQLLGSSSNISLFEGTSASVLTNEIKERYLGQPLWKYAVILALLFMVAEILFIRFLK